MLASKALWIALASIVAVAPALLFAALVLRSRRLRGARFSVLGTLALGALAAAPAALAERSLERWTGLDPRGASPGSVTMIVYALLVVAPLGQALKVAAVVPALRARHMRGTFEGLVFAAASATGFVCLRNAELLRRSQELSLDVARALLSAPAHPFFAAVWGVALGRAGAGRLGGRRFSGAWLGAVISSGIYEHIVFQPSPTALLGAVPMLLTMAFVAFVARDLVLGEARGERSSRRRFLRSIAPPSLDTMRDAILRGERPVMLSFIVFGALVTVGAMTFTLAGAVAAGHSIGVDFSAVDAPSGAASSTAPLVLLGAAALSAFPVAGFLLARASSVRTVLEPAMSAGLAIVGTLVLLGLAAPVAVVFALAFAPIAFGLACAGAWVGLGR